LQHAAPDSGKPGLERYSSGDGAIFIQQTGSVVVAVESFDSAVAERLIALGLKQGQESPQPASTGSMR
jgi:hypothetical protein